jgi:hypothetical protein
MELYLKMPNIASIENMTEEEKKELREFKELKRDFIKYFRESIFLFEEDSNVHSILNEILDKLDFWLFDKERGANYYDNLSYDSKLTHTEKLQNIDLSIPNDLLKLEKSMQPYLDFKKIEYSSIDNVLLILKNL